MLHWPTAIIRPKSLKFKIGHDGILPIGNFILMIKNHILLFQLPGNCPTTKKCAPYFRGNTEFPIYYRHILCKYESFKIQKQIGKFFPRVFKMTLIFKMAENWLFVHNSVSFEHFCVLFLCNFLRFRTFYT
jgi:hypothetical protein